MDVEELFFIWITAMGGREDHAVTDAENAARLRQSRAGFVALCGDEFQGADMNDAPGPKCIRCGVVIEGWTERSRLIKRVLQRPRETQTRGIGRHAWRLSAGAYTVDQIPG